MVGNCRIMSDFAVEFGYVRNCRIMSDFAVECGYETNHSSEQLNFNQKVL